MSEDKNHRYEDIGLGRLIKYWPFIVLVFTAGAWYQTSKTNTLIVQKVQLDIDDNKTRITRVEDAVIYLKEIVKEDRRSRVQ